MAAEVRSGLLRAAWFGVAGLSAVTALALLAYGARYPFLIAPLALAAVANATLAATGLRLTSPRGGGRVPAWVYSVDGASFALGVSGVAALAVSMWLGDALWAVVGSLELAGAHALGVATMSLVRRTTWRVEAAALVSVLGVASASFAAVLF